MLEKARQLEEATKLKDRLTPQVKEGKEALQQSLRNSCKMHYEDYKEKVEHYETRLNEVKAELQLRQKEAEFDINDVEDLRRRHKIAKHLLQKSQKQADKFQQEVSEKKVIINTMISPGYQENKHFVGVYTRFTPLKDLVANKPEPMELAQALQGIPVKDHVHALLAYYIAAGDALELPFSVLEGVFDQVEDPDARMELMNDVIALCCAGKGARQMIFLTILDTNAIGD